MESFIWTKTRSRSTSLFLSAAWMDAVVCPPLTIWKWRMPVRSRPFGDNTVSMLSAVAVIPLLYAKNISGLFAMVFLNPRLTFPRA